MKTISLITTEELAELCHVAPDTIRYWRHIGTGPKHFRMGGKRVFYRQEDVEAWISERYAEANPTHGDRPPHFSPRGRTASDQPGRGHEPAGSKPFPKLDP
jgi:predicted DNA-binding transcriptional regulator AlpA